MKIHDPYLVLMYCDTHYATIMAELNTGPDTERDKILEAETLKFKGNGKPAFRDLDEEKLEVDLVRKRKFEQESQKFLNIEKIPGGARRSKN